jgi:hypothetical protein
MPNRLSSFIPHCPLKTVSCFAQIMEDGRQPQIGEKTIKFPQRKAEEFQPSRGEWFWLSRKTIQVVYDRNETLGVVQKRDWKGRSKREEGAVEI